MKDSVNNPSHYASGSIECIDAMESMLSRDEFIGYLRGNIFKYQWRYKHKNGLEDLKKAEWYQRKLISVESRGAKVESEGESLLATQLKALKIEFEQEFKFHPKRKWRADFHLVEKMILVEVEGGIWSGGRHTRGKGYLGDMEKYNAATVMGYQVLRFSTEQVKSGLAIQQIEKMVGDRG